jgi:predicted nucleotidyltransferase
MMSLLNAAQSTATAATAAMANLPDTPGRPVVGTELTGIRYNCGMHPLIEQHRGEIESLCRKYGVKRLELFGSAARGDFDHATSDVDFFYEFDPSVAATAGLADRFFGLQEALRNLLGVDVDLISATDATNPYFLQVANRHRVTLYAA